MLAAKIWIIALPESGEGIGRSTILKPVEGVWSWRARWVEDIVESRLCRKMNLLTLTYFATVIYIGSWISLSIVVLWGSVSSRC